MFTRVISSRDDFHIGVWSFTCKFLHGLVGAEMVFTPGRFHPRAEDRDEIVPG